MWISILVAILAVSLPACSGKDSLENPTASTSQQSVTPPEEEQNSEKRLIVAFGDSLTAGTGVSKEEAYPALLQRRLERLGLPYEVVNAGITGDTTSGGLRRVQGIIQSRPDIVLLELGANDGLRGIPLNVIEDNLESIVEQLRGEGIRVVLMGMRLPPNYGWTYTSGFQKIYGKVSQKYKLPLVPFLLEDVAAKPELNLEDGIHPNPTGYKIVEENLWPVIEPLLEEVSAAGNPSRLSHA